MSNTTQLTEEQIPQEKEKELSALAGAKKQELDANSKDMELLIISKTPKQYR